MPYKIIQTLEKGRPVLTSIPDSWEEEGVLYWPRKNPEKLIKNEQIFPQQNWLKSNCTVKRRNIISYEEAEKEIGRMSDHSDTEPCVDTENEAPDPVKQKKRQKIQPTPFQNVNFNSLAQECLMDQNVQEVITDDRTLYSQVYTIESNTTPEQKTLLTTLTDKVEYITLQLPTIIANQKLILQNQQLLSENQQVLILKFGELGTQFDEIVKQCSPVMTERIDIDFKIIENKEEAEILETKLRDSDFKAELEKKFSVYCGKDRGKALNNAYVLIDLIFSREFLKQCSWAGGSRNEEPKICFRAYERIFDFFFNLVKMTDKNFTKEECKIFFKNVLRNSISRSKCKQVRASTCRNRPKSIKRKLETSETAQIQVDAQKSKPNMSEEIPHEEAQLNKSSDEEGLC